VAPRFHDLKERILLPYLRIDSIATVLHGFTSQCLDIVQSNLSQTLKELTQAITKCPKINIKI
jgi:hypothetical protein